ncbi:MAG: hypothetical protein WC480_04590 [Patescibacteria group bacterium]
MPQCKNCQQQFNVLSEDRAYYQKLGLPEPTHCPDCRCQRRMTTRNERNFYPRQCEMCGKNSLSIYAVGQPFPVYCRECWNSDQWGAEKYAQDFDWSRPFFDQFAELQAKVPRVAILTAGGNIVNSDFCNYLGDAKNCYLCFGSIFIENCLYGNPYYSKDCVDNFLIRDCELCYQCITCEHLYSCLYCQDCFDSNNLFYCYDCKGCSECIGCAGLRNVNHYIFNKKVSDSEYQEYKAKMDLCDPTAVNEIKRQLAENKLAIPRRYYQGVKNLNVSGNYINESKNSYHVFDVKRCEDSRYSAQVIDLKDCYDNNFTENNELCCDYISSWKNYKICYSSVCYQCNDTYYSDVCDSSKNLFGCCTLRKKQFYILNKPYTESEYNQTLPKIIEHMKKTGEWGEFFPIAKSIFCYNETVANEYFPITEQEAIQKGWRWKPKDNREYQKQTYQVPTNIKDVPESILKEILACSGCEKNFKIIKPELSFYQQFGLPIPDKCPFCRHLERMAARNPRRLWSRQCQCDKSSHNHGAICSASLETTYAPERPEKVYCQECYEKEMY